MLASSDAEWERIAPLTGAARRRRRSRIYRDRYRDGIPRRPIADEEADARALYRVLAEIGGRELVGPAAELDPGTFYHAVPRRVRCCAFSRLPLFLATWWIAALFVGGARLLPASACRCSTSSLAEARSRRAVPASRRDAGARRAGLRAGDVARHRDRLS